MNLGGESGSPPFLLLEIQQRKEHFHLDPIHLIITISCMWRIFQKMLLFALIASVSTYAGGQSKTRTQIKLENIQTRQNRLIEAHRNVDNQTDQDTIEFRLFALRDEYQVLLSQNPENVAVLATYGLFLAEIDQREDSLRLLLKADALEPNHPQVKNQLGNYMIEEANYALALPYYLDAITLSPQEPLYHYQMGNLLFYFKKQFVREKVFSEDHLNNQMFQSFKRAAELAEDNLAYRYRYAEAFYDYPNADLKDALIEWKSIEASTASERDKQIIRLQQANIHLLLGEKELAKIILDDVDDPYLESNKAKLIKQLEGE